MNTDPKTVDETVKALKCCSRVDAQCIGCDDCPFEYCGPECNALCKNAHDLIESLQTQLADYHHMSELVDGKMAENQRLRRINENLQSQLAASQRREQAAVEDKCVLIKHLRLCGGWCCGCKHFAGLDGCRNGQMEKCTGQHDLYEWRGPQDGKGEAE